jgi:hypothetical protein
VISPPAADATALRGVVKGRAMADPRKQVCSTQLSKDLADVSKEDMKKVPPPPPLLEMRDER